MRAPGVNVTTEPPKRDGASAVITGSWNTIPVKVSAAPRLVFRAPARMTPALTGITVLLPVVTGLATDRNNRGEHSGRARGGAIRVDEGQRSDSRELVVLDSSRIDTLLVILLLSELHASRRLLVLEVA